VVQHTVRNIIFLKQ